MSPPKNTQIKQPTRTHTLTGFLTSRSPPLHYTNRQANRILIIRNGSITDIWRNLKQEKCQADWILHENSEIITCFPNRQEFVNYCTTHGHQHFGPQASFFIPETATQPPPWIIITDKLTNNDKGLLSDSDLDSDSDSSDFTTVKSKNMKHTTDSLLDQDTNTETTSQTTTQTITQTPVSPNTQNTEQINHKQTSDTALQINHHTNKSNNPLYIKTLANQLKIQIPKTYWSEKNKTTTLIFTTKTELNTFKEQIHANTFGNQAKYYLPTPKNSVTHTGDP